jgi:DNA-damage-inducible protein J
MAQTTISIRIDEDVKRQFDTFCSDMGMNMSVAFNIFAKAVLREHRIPFEIADPFYNENHLAYLQKSIADIEAGRGLVVKTLKELEDMENG